jgi:hypothetical protein
MSHVVYLYKMPIWDVEATKTNNMKTKTILKTMVILCVAIMLNGCAGKDGAPGATGPQGTNGVNGVANISTTNFTVYAGTWTTLKANYGYDYVQSVSAITDYNNDAVEVFFQTTAGADWIPLPVSNWFINGDELTYEFNNGAVVIYYYSSVSTTAPSSTIYFNVKVIPPAIMKQHPNTNWKDYKEVQSIINSQKANQ